jgi:hypothetical protein
MDKNDRIYQAGMALAEALRKAGKHDMAHDLEVWVLDFLREGKSE